MFAFVLHRSHAMFVACLSKLLPGTATAIASGPVTACPTFALPLEISHNFDQCFCDLTIQAVPCSCNSSVICHSNKAAATATAQTIEPQFAMHPFCCMQKMLPARGCVFDWLVKRSHCCTRQAMASFMHTCRRISICSLARNVFRHSTPC